MKEVELGKYETEQLVLAFKVFLEAVNLVGRSIAKAFGKIEPALRKHYLKKICIQLRRYKESKEEK